VNGRSRPVIMEDMQERISRGDIDLERKEAIKVRYYNPKYRKWHAANPRIPGHVRYCRRPRSEIAVIINVYVFFLFQKCRSRRPPMLMLFSIPLSMPLPMPLPMQLPYALFTARFQFPRHAQNTHHALSLL
jgi:hypothetical protein